MALLVFLLFLSVWCMVTFANCLLNDSDFSLFVMAVLLLNFVVLLVACVGFLFMRLEMVFQCMCVFVRWSQFSCRCCFHMSSLCFCMDWSISVLSSDSCGSVWLMCLHSFLWSIRVRMFSGRSLCLFFILP